MIDENKLIVQVQSLEIMIGQVMMMQKEVKEDTKALRIEYQNYRKDMDHRLSQLEYWKSATQEAKISQRIEQLEKDRSNIAFGWRVIIIGAGFLGYLFQEKLKKILLG